MAIFQEDGVAIKGYDVVAYFRENRAIIGEETYSYKWADTKWLFGSQEYLDLFKSDPEKYLPQYGGYCAFGTSEGYLAATNPEAFTIYRGKLYLNFAKYVRKRWSEKIDAKIATADRLWPDAKVTQPIKAKPIPIWWKYQLFKLFGKDLFK